MANPGIEPGNLVREHSSTKCFSYPFRDQAPYPLAEPEGWDVLHPARPPNDASDAGP